MDVDDDINELSFLEFIHNLVETLDKYFENVCELDIMFNIEKAHFIMDEMVMNGYILETNKANILNPVVAVVKSAGLWWKYKMQNIYLCNLIYCDNIKSLMLVVKELIYLNC